MDNYYYKSWDYNHRITSERGLVNKNNSCYCDVTLFSMFARTTIFDHLFIKNSLDKSEGNNTVDTREVYSALRNIVFQLRGPKKWCPSILVQNFRDSLCCVNPRMKYEMLDVDEFLTTFFSRALNLQRFIRYSVGSGDFLHNLFVSLNSSGTGMKLMDIQSAFEQSMKNQGLSLAAVPFPALFVKMPRGRGEANRSSAVLPNIILDVSSCMVENGKGHTSGKLELLAVICLSNYHYTTFVRERKNSWCYFDSLCGVQTAHNIEDELIELENDSKFLKRISYYTQVMITTIHMCIYKPLEDEWEKEEMAIPNSPTPSQSSSQGKKNRSKRRNKSILKYSGRSQHQSISKIEFNEEQLSNKQKNFETQDNWNFEESMEPLATVMEISTVSQSYEGESAKTMDEAQVPEISPETFTHPTQSENDSLIQTPVDEEAATGNLLSKRISEKCFPSTYLSFSDGVKGIRGLLTFATCKLYSSVRNIFMFVFDWFQAVYYNGALEKSKIPRENFLIDSSMEVEEGAELSLDASSIEPAQESNPTPTLV